MDLRGIRQMSLDDPHAIEREEDQVRFSDNSAPFKSSPKTAVVAVVAVVSHHEKLVRPENDLFMQLGNKKDVRYVHAFTKEELERLAEDAGFEHIEVHSVARPSGYSNLVLTATRR